MAVNLRLIIEIIYLHILFYIHIQKLFIIYITQINVENQRKGCSYKHEASLSYIYICACVHVFCLQFFRGIKSCHSFEFRFVFLCKRLLLVLLEGFQSNKEANRTKNFKNRRSPFSRKGLPRPKWRLGAAGEGLSSFGEF